MLAKFLVLSTIFASALAQVNDYFYIRNVVSQNVLDINGGTKGVKAVAIANAMDNTNIDRQLWTFDDDHLVNKLSGLYLTVEGSPESLLNVLCDQFELKNDHVVEVGSSVVLADLSSQSPSAEGQSWTIDPVKKRLMPGDSSLCLTISTGQTTGDQHLPLTGLSRVDYSDAGQQWEFIPGPGA